MKIDLGYIDFSNFGRWEISILEINGRSLFWIQVDRTEAYSILNGEALFGLIEW